MAEAVGKKSRGLNPDFVRIPQQWGDQGGLPEEEIPELSSSSKTEGGVSLAEGTDFTEAWQQNRVCSLGSCAWCDAARVESKCGARGARMGESKKMGSWVSEESGGGQYLALQQAEEEGQTWVKC